MELNKITWIGVILGMGVIILSLIKWFFMIIYLSRLMFGVGIGFMIICFAYIYECLKMHDKHKDHLNRRVDELSFWARTQGFDE